MKSFIKYGFLTFLWVLANLSVSGQNWNGGIGDGFDNNVSTSYTQGIVSKFNGSSGDGYDHDLSQSYSMLTVSKFNGGTYDGYSYLTGVYQELNHGVISGTITDNETGDPIEGAIVYATGNYEATHPSFSNGKYTINNVPFGLGYHVTAYVSGYKTETVTGVNVLSSDPIVTVNLAMTPLSIEPTITELTPDPNPGTSVIRKGGALHRHYLIKDINTGLPLSGIQVEVKDLNNPTQVYTYKSDDDGIADIKISYQNIGNGQVGNSGSFSIFRLNGNDLSSAINFNCQIEEPVYSKFWHTNSYVALGLAFIDISLENGKLFILTENNSTNSDPENLLIKRQQRAGIGKSFGVGATAEIQMGHVKYGVDLHASVGSGISGITEDTYEFPYISESIYESMAKYIVYANGSFDYLDTPFKRLKTKLEEILLNDPVFNTAYLNDSKGFDVSIDAGARASLGGQIAPMTTLQFDANIGADGHVVRMVTNHNTDNSNEYLVNVSGSFSTSGDLGIKMDFPKISAFESINEEINLWNENHSCGIEFSVYKNNTNGNFLKFELKFLHRNNNWEEITKYTISGEDAYNEISNLLDEIESLCNSYNSATTLVVDNNTFLEIAKIIFEKLFEIQNNIDVEYEKEVKEITDNLTYGINLSISALLKASIAAGINIVEGKSKIKNSGKWMNGKTLLIEQYSNNISDIDINYSDLLQDIIYEIPLWIRLSLGGVNTLFTWAREETIFYITDSTYTDTTAWICFPSGSIPSTLDSVYCVSWGWYGSSTRSLLSEITSPKVKRIYQLNRQRAENSYGMRYGIGGFFQVAPLDTLLLDTAQMTITYMDSSLVNIDETTLGMYMEDKTNHTWIYIGGEADTANNEVTAPITKLAMYTLAPAMPFGSFTLNPANDSLYADSISTTTITSGIIYYNNTDTIEDGELFTVNTDAGLITTADADTSIDGIQVSSLNSQISFDLKSSHIAATATISAFSVNGSAQTDTTVIFYDTIPPAAPTGLTAESVNDKINLTWQQNQEEDIAGYIIYYDSDTAGPPYEGIATVYGYPSPIVIGKDTSFAVSGLFSDSTYYLTVTAYDVSGNESDYSSEITVDLNLPDILMLNDQDISSGDTVCLNAINYIEVPIESATYTIDSGGYVIFIAGDKIIFNPGFTADPGSYVDAHITTDGSYCNIIMQPQLPSEKIPPPPEPDIIIIEGKTADNPILVYPNPSSGLITIDLPETVIYENYRIEVYDYLGRLVKKKNIHDRKEHIDLSMNQNGMYFIIIRNNDSIFRIKVIKM